MTKLTLTARRKGASEEYTPLDANSLCAQVRILSGTGMSDAPLVQEIIITAETDFEGVIRIAMPSVACTPRFFLPLYCTTPCRPAQVSVSISLDSGARRTVQ